MVTNVEVDKVADMVADMQVDMVVDMVPDMVSDMEVDINMDMEIISLFFVNIFVTFSKIKIRTMSGGESGSRRLVKESGSMGSRCHQQNHNHLHLIYFQCTFYV